ncbi:protocadherin Fat 4-like [Saccostrea echinata]|uniref:protocadherin Fat 4-like n=1 Tax=Saccostrea echinata TaxID=191078 RepID=UPI002A82154A|nr:protocadherin Fat 4-like [Saccostrea echinata]
MRVWLLLLSLQLILPGLSDGASVPIFSPDVIVVTVEEGSTDELVTTLNCTTPAGTPCPIRKKIDGDDFGSEKFKIDNTDLRTTNIPTDYEALETINKNFVYTLLIRGNDSSNSLKTAEATVFVYIDSKNEFDPEFIGMPFRALVREDAPVGMQVITLTGNDDDLGTGGEVSFLIVGGNDDNKFDINPAYGRIFTNNSLDYETKKNYTLDVRLSDGTRSVIANVVIIVTPVNDNDPQCTPQVYHVTMDDTLATEGATIYTLTCSDADGDPLTYTIESGDISGEFAIKTPPKIELRKDLDASQRNLNYLLSIKVSDGSRSTEVWLRLYVTKNNTKAPEFQSQPTVNVRESEIVGAEIILYKAFDPDKEPYGVVSYEIESVTNGGEDNFLIEETTGRIKLAKPLDYEAVTNYVLHVVARDGGGLKGTGTVTVSVLNENDNAPTCTTYSEAYNVPEDQAVSTVISTDVQCTDADGDTLTFVMVQNPPGSVFTLTNSKTVILKEPLDFETQSFYELQISVIDGGSNPVIITFMIDVTNVNEHTPVFTNSDVYYETLDETSLPGANITTVSATDGDRDAVSYSFVTPQTKFNLGSVSGQIILSRTLDAEIVSSYELLVRASDGQKESTATVSITVNDVNEAPAFEQEKYSFTNTENSDIGKVVGKVTARDPDVSGNNALFRYSIISGNINSHFLIDPDDGTISVAVSTDYEFTKAVLLVIEVIDFGTPVLSDKCTVNISIVDVNDNAPEFPTATLTKFLAENASFGDVVTRVTAKDIDSDLGDNNLFEFSSSSNVPFSVHYLTGEVTVNGQVDREMQESFEMIIEAVDKGFPARTGFVTLTITLTDINDNAPIIQGTYDRTIPENEPVHSLVFTLSATDPDTGDNGRFLYSIVSGNSDFHFKIEQTRGFIQVATDLDRESQPVYELVIKVSDLGSPQMSTSITATVTLSDVNDIIPKFNKNMYVLNINENSPIGTLVGKVDAIDGDRGINALVTYRIKTYMEGHAGKFMINTTTGEMKSFDVIDREIEDFYSIILIVEDSGFLSSEAMVNITVNDENDNLPIFTRRLYSTEVSENFTVGSIILTTTAYDLDIGFNSIISYSLDTLPLDGAIALQYFSVDTTTGNVILIKELDRELYANISMTVKASDAGTPLLSSNTTVTVFIEDINDNRPVFAPSFYNAEVSYEHACNHIITTVTALDIDQEENAEVVYEMDPVNGENQFLVDRKSGQIRTNLNVNESQNVILVRANDLGTPKLTSSLSAKIRIDSFNASETIISFSLSMGLSTYLRKESEFLSLVKKTIGEFYATAYVRRWCIEDKSTSVVVYVYAVKNDLTNWEGNLFMDKPFMTNGEFLDSLELNKDKVPTINGTDEPWREFLVTDVKPFGQNVVYPGGTSRSSSNGDKTGLIIALAIIFSLLALALLAALIIYLLWRRKNKQNKDNTSKSKPKLINVQTKGDMTSGCQNSSDTRPFVSDTDDSVCHVTMVGNPSMVYSGPGSPGSRSAKGKESPTGSGSGGDNESDPMTKIDIDGRREGLVSPTEVRMSQGLMGFSGEGYVKGGNSGRYGDDQYPENGLDSSKEKAFGNKGEEQGRGIPSGNSDGRSDADGLDGKASTRTPGNRGIDTVTGWVYEDHPENNGRQWLRTPDGDPIFEQRPFI